MSPGTRMDPLSEVIERWRSTSVRVNPPAADAAIERLAELLPAGIPAGLRTFLSLANGMKDYEMDAAHLSMWSVERIVRERKVVSRPDGDWLVIGDLMISSRLVSVCRSATSEAVRVDGIVAPYATLASFLEQHVALRP